MLKPSPLEPLARSPSASSPELRGPVTPPAAPFFLAWLLSSLVLVLHACLLARAEAWQVVDDAFISFRYLDNLLSGHGLVFNPGERVEGYTSLLWILVLAPFRLLELPLTPTARWLGIACSLGTLWVTSRLARQLFPPRATPGLALPWATAAMLLLALDGSFARWSMDGLETPLFTFLLSLTVWRVMDGAKRDAAGPVRNAVKTNGYGVSVAGESPWPFLIQGLLFGLCSLTRPEGGLYLFLTTLWSLQRGQGLRATVLRWLGWSCLVVPQLLFRIAFYQDWLPNTAHAKLEPGLIPFLHGLRYSGGFLLQRWPLGLTLLLVLLWNILKNKDKLSRVSAGSDRGSWKTVPGIGESGVRAAQASAAHARDTRVSDAGVSAEGMGRECAGGSSADPMSDSGGDVGLQARTHTAHPSFALPAWLCAGTLGYVLFTGGDWMLFGRFFVPVLPLLVLAGLRLLHPLETRLHGASRRATAAFVLAGLMLTIGNGYTSSWLGEKPWLEEAGANHLERQRLAAWLRENAPSRATLLTEELGEIPYLTGLRSFDFYGLTDAYVARFGRFLPDSAPGHQRVALAYSLSLEPDFLIMADFRATWAYNAQQPWGQADYPTLRHYAPVSVSGVRRLELYRRRVSRPDASPPGQ